MGASVSRGYATLDYELENYRTSDLVKLDIMVHHNKVDALSMIIHKSHADIKGREIIGKLKNLIKKHQFQIPLQAAVGSKVVARENISALRRSTLPAMCSITSAARSTIASSIIVKTVPDRGRQVAGWTGPFRGR